MRQPFFAFALIAISVASILKPVTADVTFGGSARAFAMGGAGIAIVDRSERNTLVNPASVALLNRRVKMNYPTIGLRASGVNLKSAYDHLFGNPDKNDATSLARDFGGKNSDFGAAVGIGMRFGHLDASANGIGVVHVIPNSSLQTWAKTANGNTGLLTGLERADMIGAGIYSLPTVTVAERISPPGSPTRIEAGARVKLMRAVYTHYVVSSDNIKNNTPAATASELNGGTTLQKDALGVDVGFLVHPKDHTGFSGALVVTDILEPRFRFKGTDQHDNPFLYDLQPRSVTAGTAYEGGKMIFAFDVVDLTRAYGNPQARFGTEYTTKKISLRSGYSSARGFTVGVQYGFFDIAIGARAPLSISQTLRF